MLRKSRQKRHQSIKKHLRVSSDRPRLSVFRSGEHIYAQIIDDSVQKTLASESDLKMKGTKVEKASQVGESLAKKAIVLKIKKVTFDRGGFLYHGRVAALAEGARKGGLEF